MTGREVRGILWGLLAVVAFSLTLPATRAAASHLGVGFVALGRAIGAGSVAAAILCCARVPFPRREDLPMLILISLGVVLGFPFLTTLAMAQVPASHGGVVVGLLPLSTVIAAAILAGERPSIGFWLTSFAGTGVLSAFVFGESGGGLGAADLALIGAVVAAAIGYALGGRLAAHMAAWQVICWALVVALPVLAIAAPFLVELPSRGAPLTAWVGFAYVTIVSQLVGFFAWYRGLALGGIARVSQTQLLQLFLTLAFSALLLGESIAPRLLVYGGLIAGTVAIGMRLRVAHTREPSFEARSMPSRDCGHPIGDECHHLSAVSAERVARR
ncbi:MAG: EamA family transporter [Hyphomicrobiaceae bacterium]|nr:MAG: EamA family transporter [Hyphomicrobiaceae bacterium]